MRKLASLTGLAVVLALAGCGAPDERRAEDPLAAARALVPEDVRAAGKLTVASDLMFEPMEYIEGGEQKGFEVDLAAAVADRLGLSLEFVQTAWEDLRPAVISGKADVVMSSMTDTAKRQEEVDFVDYLNVGSSIVVRADLSGVETLDDLCGHAVAVQAESIYQDLAESQAERCPGGRSMRIVIVPDGKIAVLAGKADAYLHDYPIAVVAADKNPKLKVAGEQIEAAPYGIAVAKERSGLRTAIQTVLFQLFRDGTYDGLLKKWNITEGSLKTGAINGGA
ncbi:ABC transporter substrate-binding protein [Actinoplanes hulinensis]|uniref:ABC transporter substrate-binding protein n=1 Tax=Actinoplanes hulinensis TaxID=1144547 RepID=A0ABS7B424_9ACTN|nr:ABC transporter substrate-binding protein [Actinoplanes hulinensis]MBW6435761.1 ABC transporter substrate-binding protein [Actinoplanes hulinensis]